MSVAMWIMWAGMAGFVGVYGWAWRRAGERGRRWLEWGLALLVAGVSAASAAMHEPWRDELHTWLVARELTLGEMWREMHWEGHVMLWQLVLHPFARGGGPVAAMGGMAWALNAVAVTWLVRRSPLTGWEKAAIGASCLFLYVNPAIARCYVLIPMVLWGLAELWREFEGGGGILSFSVVWGFGGVSGEHARVHGRDGGNAVWGVCVEERASQEGWKGLA